MTQGQLRLEFSSLKVPDLELLGPKVLSLCKLPFGLWQLACVGLLVSAFLCQLASVSLLVSACLHQLACVIYLLSCVILLGSATIFTFFQNIFET